MICYSRQSKSNILSVTSQLIVNQFISQTVVAVTVMLFAFDLRRATSALLMPPWPTCLDTK